MTRSTKSTLIRAALEPTYAGAVVPGPTDAVLAINPSHRIIRTTVPREIWFPHLGASEEMIAARVAEIKFEVEIAGSGDVAVEPQWSRLLRGCGFARTIITGANARIEWNPISQNMESLLFQYWRAGVRYDSRGARGTAKLKLPAFGLPRIEFTFMGFETNASASTLIGSYDLAAWKRPWVLTDNAAGDIRLGATLSNGTPAGGTILPSRGLEIDVGNKVEHMELLGGERISITDRMVTGRMSTAVTATDEVVWRNEINGNVNTSLAFNWGLGTGERFTVFAPKVQRVDPQGEDYKGDVLLATELRLQPTATGNDDFVLVMR